jgi:hypothetical protein
VQIKFGKSLLPFGSDFLSTYWLSQSKKIKLYRTIIFPVVLCGCENRLRVFENRVLRKIFGCKIEEVRGD